MANQLWIEHRTAGRFVRAIKLMPGSYSTAVGSSPKASLRLMGAEVSPFHAVIECRGGGWFIMDCGSETGTWYKEQGIVEMSIVGEHEFRIGQHTLSVRRLNNPRPLYTRDVEVLSSDSKNLTHQEWVLLRNGKLVEVDIKPKGQTKSRLLDGVETPLPSALDGGWVTSVVGKTEVRRRLISLPHQAAIEAVDIPEEFKKPLQIFSVLMVMAFIIGLLIPKKPTDDLSLESPSKYTEMIFDAKIIKEKRAQALKFTQQQMKNIEAAAGPQNPDPTPSTGGADSKPAVKNAISKIRATGLHQLIGKISKRAAKGANSFQAFGLSPDNPKSSRSLATLASGAKVGDGAGAALNEGPYRVDGVKTQGKGGGSGAYRSGASLATGAVGLANVGVIDEETLVEGGLDREVIAEVIKKDLGQIRYCYERQLSGNPDLYGKVVIKFTIVAEGTTTSPRIGTTTMNNAMIEGCILRRVARWKFPLPKGGTSVLVTYPFLFKATQ
ncbi:MAG: hypothetical protein COT74_06565 [Bdellovibrionales bacterium CG10_big_fil_rev_8_21_14_0_10_45_34]|nr:MAG: hypothetical protein COT74_06565 [Bdellovibrionales bacterium CG10_big_fil_rev_8_21_14_0_10_45_34]